LPILFPEKISLILTSWNSESTAKKVEKNI
jgi:hypothetical protein